MSNPWDIDWGNTTATSEEDPHEEQRKWIEQLRTSEAFIPCSLNQPLLLVIPREGIVIQCPVHSKGHFLRPSLVTF